MLTEIDHFYATYLAIVDAYERFHVTEGHRSAYANMSLAALRAIRDSDSSEAHKSLLLAGIRDCHDTVKKLAYNYDVVHFGNMPDFRKKTYDQARSVLDKFYRGEPVEVELSRPVPEDSAFALREGTLVRNSKCWIGHWTTEVGKVFSSFTPTHLRSTLSHNVYYGAM